MKKIILMLLLISGIAAFAKAQDTTKMKMTPEQRVPQVMKAMQKKMNLTPDQNSKITAILMLRAQKMESITPGVKGAGRARMIASADADKQINALLTKDQQNMYALMKETQKENAASRKQAKNMPPPAPPVQ